MRRFFPLIFLLAVVCGTLPVSARPFRFPKTGAHVFMGNLPDGWSSTTDKRGGLLLVPPDNHALVYLAILVDDKLRGHPDSAAAASVAKIAGIEMSDKQDAERLLSAKGARLLRGTAFYGTLPGKGGLERKAKIVLFRLAPDTWAQVWTVTQPGMNPVEYKALDRMLNSLTLTGK